MSESQYCFHRLPEFDYSTPGAYFITVCTNGKRNYFWKSVAALTAQPLAACPLRVASALQVGNDCSTFCAASPPSLSLRGGRRPTWQSRSIRLNRGKAIGEIATAFPRLHPKGTSSRFALRAPRPRWGLAMTIRGLLPFYRQTALAGRAAPGPAVRSPVYGN